MAVRQPYSLLFIPFYSAIFPFLLMNLIFVIKGQYLVEVLERTALGGHRAVVRCDATGANFGEDVLAFSFGINNIGCAIKACPINACLDVVKPQLNSTTQCIVDFAVVPRGNCSFSEKAYYVQTAKPNGYSALIVYNDKGQSPIPMSGSKYAELVQIPVVMVKYECMQSMLGHYSAEHGYLVTIKSSPGYYDLIKYLFPFVIIVGICFIVLFISLMIRLCRERRRLARKRLPRSQLKKIPTKKYRKGDPEETCAICLEDFQESEKLRILECRHAYHCKCIDPWLTKSRKVCPICKRHVGPRSADSSDSDETDTERTISNGSSSAGVAASTSALHTISHRDNDPLLQNAQPIANSYSQDLIYPQTIISSQQPSTSAVSGFMRATRNLWHSNSIFQPNRCEFSRNDENAPTTSTTTTSAEITTTPASIEPQHTNFLHSSPELEDLSNLEQQQQPQRQQSGRQFGRFSLAQIGNRLAGLVRRGASSASLSNNANPHLLLENEEDTSTTVTREDLDSISRRACNSDETNSNSVDGHSMTTQHSNHHLVSIAVEEPSQPQAAAAAAVITTI